VKNLNILGVILARAGSKAVPNKNLLKVGNKSLIEIAMSEAKKSKKLSKIIFSTDSSVMRKIAKKNNIESPFLRPKYLAGDKSKTYDVIRHSVEWLEKNQNWQADIVVVLQPTTPFRKAEHIDRCINLLIRSNADASMAVTTPDYPPMWMLKMDKNKKTTFIFKNGKKFTRRQDMPKIFKPAGLVYALNRDFLFKIKGILPQGDTRSFVVNEKDSLNIDEYYHYILAKQFSTENIKKKKKL
jgi:CMP-N,N'-diacetyllegionaminic acid synthase